jgi:NTP pyrophosphatase (non-canonical NTP hydrolase)
MDKARAARLAVLAEVDKEADRGQAEYGKADWSPSVGLSVLVKELGEVAGEVLAMEVAPAQTARARSRAGGDVERYRTELLHVAAVAVRLVEGLDSKQAG